jgi:8-oxo-dGTP pyrophosphatase MutT (NUDIX family)
MQVYLAVQNAKCNTIIVKKRELNHWWGSKAKVEASGSVQSSLVNQAGQWALPGGRKEAREPVEEAAVREFSEETGFTLDLTTATKIQVMIQNKHYALVRVQYNWVQSILDQINANLQPNSSNDIMPNSLFVKDWELGSAALVGVHALKRFLGVPQQVSPEAQPARLKALRAKPWSQAINWYAEMAKALSEASRPD